MLIIIPTNQSKNDKCNTDIHRVISYNQITSNKTKHISDEGARYHVLWWDSNGCHCTVPNCEINK